MDNGNMPAMPLNPEFGMNDMPYTGLTKREHFAIKLMAAARSNAFMFERADTDSKVLAKGAIQDADALLKELSK